MHINDLYLRLAKRRLPVEDYIHIDKETRNQLYQAFILASRQATSKKICSCQFLLSFRVMMTDLRKGYKVNLLISCLFFNRKST